LCYRWYVPDKYIDICKKPFENTMMILSKLSMTLTLIVLSLALIVSPHLVAATTGATSTTERLSNTYAQYVGSVNVAVLPTPVEGADTPVSLPTLTIQAKAQSSSDPFTVVTPGSQSFIHINKDFGGTPGTNPNPCRCTPPDMGLAASSKFVVQMVNLAGTIWKNNGVKLTTFSLADFWFLPTRGGPFGIGMSDPQVLYDAAADRFYASIIDTFDVNRVNFAVTATNDPTGAWYIYRVIAAQALGSVVSSHTLPDQPYIGYSADKFLITANDFTYDATFSAAVFDGSQYWILNKAEMLSGCTAPTPCPNGRNIDAATNMVNPVGTNGKFAVRSVQHLSATPTLVGDSTPTAYLAENCLTVTSAFLVNTCPTSITGGGINVYTVHGTPPAPTSVSEVTVPIATTGFPDSADQPGNPASLTTNDNRILSAVWRNGLLWTALNDGPPDGGGPCTQASCARLDQISTASYTALQDFDLVLPTAAVFYPALSTDVSNNLVVIYGSSSSTKFPDLEVVGQLPSMSPGSVSSAAVLVAGTAADLSTRYGDYFWAATDPSTPSTFWVAGEFRTVSLFQGWSTQVGQVAFNTN
jgi:hypothetical protein